MAHDVSKNGMRTTQLFDRNGEWADPTMLAQTKAAGLRIVPVCPTVTAFCKKHPEYADVVDRPTRQVIDRLQR